MDKKEKVLANKLINIHKNPAETKKDFSQEEQLIIDRWFVQGIINTDAFEDMTSISADSKQYYYSIGYPFTSKGEEEYKKNRYFQFRDSNSVKIVRDVFTVIAFFASLFAIFYSLFN